MKNIKKRLVVSCLTVAFGIITVLSSFTVAAKNPVKIPGDMNGDGEYTSADLVVAKRMLIGAITLDEQVRVMADVNDDDTVTISDFVRLKKMLLSVDGNAGGNQEAII